MGYEALKRQTSKDFKWLIIDDGSTDNTKELVDSWIAEGVVEIEYCYKENGGMHTGHNKAYELINTELNVCIDSDDYMTDNAVELIINRWRKEGNSEYAGLMGLDVFTNGKVVGTPFPTDLRECKYSEKERRYGVYGDIKCVFRTDLIKEYMPYPVFSGEKFVPLNYPYALISKKYKMLCSNDVYCGVEYMEDGSTINITRQYAKNPNGFAFTRKIMMKESQFFIDRVREAMHYVSSSIFLKNRSFIAESPCKILTVFAIIPGVLFHTFVLWQNSRNRMRKIANN
jgi:glycosyltransferase involved in cell wall biosynthesis